MNTVVMDVLMVFIGTDVKHRPLKWKGVNANHLLRSKPPGESALSSVSGRRLLRKGEHTLGCLSVLSLRRTRVKACCALYNDLLTGLPPSGRIVVLGAGLGQTPRTNYFEGAIDPSSS